MMRKGLEKRMYSPNINNRQRKEARVDYPCTYPPSQSTPLVFVAISIARRLSTSFTVPGDEEMRTV